MISDTTIARQQYTLSTGTDALSFDFYTLDATHLTVWNVPADGSSPALLVLNTDYSATGTQDEEGNVTVTMIGQAAGDVITILREPTMDQLLELVFKGRIYEESLEQGLDKVTMICLHLKELIDRCLKYPPTETAGWIAELDAAADRAGKIIRYTDSGALALVTELGDWEGEWVTATAYQQYDMFRVSSTASVYFALTDHTSSSVSADLAASKIAVVIDGSAITDAQAAAEAAQAAAEAAQVASETAQGLSEAAQGHSEEWANKAEDSLVSAAAGGDEVDDYSSLHWAKKSEAFAEAAELNANAAGAVSIVDLKGVRSNGTSAALFMPAKDFGSLDHSIGITIKRPSVETVLWSNQEKSYDYADVQDEVLRKLGGALVVSGATATGITWDAATGAMVTDDDCLQLKVGQQVLVQFDMDNGAACDPFHFRSSGDSFSTVGSDNYQPVTGTNSHVFTITGGAGNFVLYIDASGVAGGTLSNLTMRILGAPYGERLVIQRDGKLRLEFGNGTDFSTYSFTSDASIPVPVGSFARILTSLDRDGGAAHFVNGAHLKDSLGANEYLDISGASAQTVSTGEQWQLLSDGSQFNYGQVCENFSFDNYALQADIALQRFLDPTLWTKTESPSFIVGQWDWTVGLDGWTGTRVATSLNQTIGGEGGWLKMTPDTNNNTHTLSENSLPITIPSGSKVRLNLKVFVPEGQGVDITGVHIRYFHPSGAPGEGAADFVVPFEEIYNLEYEFTTGQENGRLYIYALKGASTESFAGDAVSHLYIKQAELFIYGEIERSIDLTAGGPQKPDLIGSSHGYYLLGSGVEDTVQAESITLDATATADGWLVYDQTSNDLLPDGYFIESIYAEETSGNATTDIDIGYSSSTAEIVSAMSHTANEKKFAALVTQFPTTRKIHIHANSGTGVWNSGSLTVRVTLRKESL